MTNISIDVTGLSGRLTVEVPSGASAADVREAAGLNEGLALRANGETISDEASYTVEDGDTLVSAPPAAKHG